MELSDSNSNAPMDFQEGSQDGGQDGGQGGGAKKRLTKKQHCAPGNKMKQGSCLNEHLIRKVAKIMNGLHKKKGKKGKTKKGKTKKGKGKKGKGKKGIDSDTDTDSESGKRYEQMDLTKPCHQLHLEICKNLEQVDACDAEACLLFKDNILKGLTAEERDEFEASFIPVMDEDMLETKVKKKKVKKDGQDILQLDSKVDEGKWISTKNIEECCLQDEDAYSEYQFMGAEPIDFSDCKVSPLCRFNHEKLKKKGKTKLGFVFNTDPHDKDGEHWISMYIDLVGHNLRGSPGIYYFDSYGKKPPSEIQELITETREASQKNKEPMRYFYNEHPFQTGGAQCGLYAIHFLKEMVQGIQFEDYLNLKPCERLMKQKRYEYFINPGDLIKKI